MHEHVLEMTNLAARLKDLGMDANECFFVQFSPCLTQILSKYILSKLIFNHTFFNKIIFSITSIIFPYFLTTYFPSYHYLQYILSLIISIKHTLILNSLPTQYEPFQIHYNTNKEKWYVNESASMLAQEEARLKQQGHHLVNVMSHRAGSKGKKSKKSFKKDPLKIVGTSNANGVYKKERNGPKCYFCHCFGHLKKDCPKCRAWFEKKGIPFNP